MTRPMRRAGRTILPALLLWASACAASDSAVLRLEDVQGLSVVEGRGAAGPTVRISGLAFHSALAVERIETVTEGDTLVVQVHLVLARRGLSGSFETNVAIPPGIRHVAFGVARQVVWTRSPAADRFSPHP